MASFSKFERPAVPSRSRITDRDLDILEAILRYRFCSAAQIVRLAGGNEDVTHRRLRGLWERGLAARWAFPGFRTHSEFYYYLDSRAPRDLLVEGHQLEIHQQMLEEIRSHREKDYSGAAVRGQHMQFGFLNHGPMISRMHFMVEMACRKSGGAVALEVWCQRAQIASHKADVPRIKSSRQGGELFWQEVKETERLPVEPDALFSLRFANRPQGDQLADFCCEADRGSMVMTDMLKKFSWLLPLHQEAAKVQGGFRCPPHSHGPGRNHGRGVREEAHGTGWHPLVAAAGEPDCSGLASLPYSPIRPQAPLFHAAATSQSSFSSRFGRSPTTRCTH
jgi:hypothetical protein